MSTTTPVDWQSEPAAITDLHSAQLLRRQPQLLINAGLRSRDLVSLGGLIGEPTLMEWTEEPGQRTVPALRVALMSHRQFLLQGAQSDEPIRLDRLEREVVSEWENYLWFRYSRLSRRLPPLITGALIVSQQYGADTDDGLHAHRLLASVYQLATGFLTKVGEADLASLSATKGLSAAHASGSESMVGSLYRSVAYALLAMASTNRSSP